MAKEYIHGEMEGNMMEIITWIKSMVMVFIIGQMEENMKDNGKMEGNMEKGNTPVQIRK